MRVKLESREGGAATVLMRIVHKSAFDGISMNVILMTNEILGVANPVIGESTLPDFTSAAEDFA
jgi:hypothetical protein